MVAAIADYHVKLLEKLPQKLVQKRKSVSCGRLLRG
jgi:hypothetical protein